MKKVLLSVLIGTAALATQAQVITPITTIQTVSAADLANCNDTPPTNGQTFTVRGVVLHKGGIDRTVSGTGNRQLWIRGLNVNFGTPFNSAGLFGNAAITEFSSVFAGDTIQADITVFEYNPVTDAETELVVTPGSFSVIGFAAAGATRPAPVPVPVSDLMSAGRLNNLATGERWEGEYVQIDNVQVTEVQAFNPNRFSFYVRDANGNEMNVADRFLAMRTPANNPQGRFTPPSVGDRFVSIRGIIVHSKNNCPGANGRGYTINPTDSTDFVKGASAPSISNFRTQFTTPAANQANFITVTITPGSDLSPNPTPSLTTAQLKWGTGSRPTDITFPNTVTLINVGGTNDYTGAIPGQQDGTFVRYYVTASNSLQLTNNVPAVLAPTNQAPRFYTVRNSGLTIYDVQYTPYRSGTNATSGYVGNIVTLTGVVTATSQAGDLGIVFIQQEGAQAWGGIWIKGGPTLATLSRGARVSVQGTVAEATNGNSMTLLENIGQVTVLDPGPIAIAPITLPPSTFSTWSIENEAYEGMLVKIANPAGGLYVVDDNISRPSNFGEYRIGVDPFDPAAGTPVHAGRQATTAFSSLNVSYVNSSRWATQDGAMAVDTIIVKVGDQITSVTGVMFHAFGTHKLQPRNNADFEGYIVDAASEIAKVRLSLYPNPASGYVQIKGLTAKAEVKIMDVAGRTFSQTSVSENARIDVSSLSAGIYVASVTTGNSVQNIRFVVAK